MKMSKRIVITSAVFALLPAVTAIAETSAANAAKTVSLTEQQVRDVINRHFEGIRKGDAELIKEAWDVSNARVTHISRGRVSSAPVEKSIKLWASKPAPKSKGEIQSIDVVSGQMALAKVHLNWHGGTFDDFLTLAKTRQGWKIIDKTYVSRGGSPYSPPPSK